MAANLGRSSPAYKSGDDDDDRVVSEAGINRRHQLPRLVTPTPIHAGLSSLTSSGGVGPSSVLPPDQIIEEEPMNNSSPLHSSSSRARADVESVLPVKGDYEDAQAAIDKLERMQKAIQSRRMWLKGSGAEGMAKVATAGGKRAYGKHEKTTTPVDDTESVISLPRYGEVKLGISSLPGYPVMAAQRAKQFLGRSNAKSQSNEDNKSKHQSDFDSAGEGSSSAWSSLPLRKPRSLRLLKRGPSVAPASSIKTESDGLMPAHKIETNASASTNSTTHPAAQHTSDLTSVKEILADERTPISAAHRSKATATDDVDAGKAKQLNRPRLVVQCPSENGLQPLVESEPLRNQDNTLPSIGTNLATSSSSGEDDETCDDRAQKAAEACQDHLAMSPILPPGEARFMDSPPSSSASTSDNENDNYTSDSEGSQTPTTPQEELMLNLEHGEELTKKQKKRILRKLRKSASGGEDRDDQDESKLNVVNKRKATKRQGTLSNRMQSGLQYASSQSRNRRAMERYSPHPSRPSSTAPSNPLFNHSKVDGATNLADVFNPSRQSLSGLPSASLLGETSRSSTPVALNGVRDSGLDSRRSSMSEKERVVGMGINQMVDGNFCMSPIVDDHVNREDRWGDLGRSIRRQGTANSITSSMTGKETFRKRYFSLRRKKQDTVDVAEESDSGANTPRVDPEKELDSMLRNLAAEQAPDQIQEQYEFDVLYENQRGMMFFGIPKFSARTLFQWDPASWTNARNENSAYNIVNAQLPNPYWEWVHPEWMIDMTGDVDESGWQYSYNFGRLSLSFNPRPETHIPRAGVKGNTVMNDRMVKKNEKREERNNSVPDEGFEALKRTARSRNAKWTGIPDQNKYVRRRRWIRLRRRKALQLIATIASTPNAGTPLGIGKASGDWSDLVKEEGKRREKEEKKRMAARPGNLAISSSSSSTSSEDDSISDLESDSSGSEYASKGATSSTFIPQRTPGNSNRGAMDNHTGKEQERLRRHAKEFTGTIRELKSLLPSIMDRRHSFRTSNRQRFETELWMSEVDARNPFISWNLVKKRLDDDDLAFASTSLRARERRYAQRMLERRENHHNNHHHDDLTETAAAEFELGSSHYELTKDAVVEINYRRVMRVMRACKVDRHKLQLWKIWLGVEPISSISEVAREEDLLNTGMSTNIDQERQDALRQAKIRWRKAFPHPDVMDVWDLLERRLDRLLLTFEYQGSRASLLRLLLTLHATSHWAHRFQTNHTMIESDSNFNVPSSISPQASSGNLWNLTAGQSSTQFLDEWRGVGLPRLEFWSDLEECARMLVGNQQKHCSSESGRKDLTSLLSPTTTTTTTTTQGRSSPLLNSNLTLAKSSPTPSIIRSTTPQMMGSLANGPSARRLTTSHSSSPLLLPSTFKVPSKSFAFGKEDNNNIQDHTYSNGDHSFLADLLQLPPQRQQEILVNSAKPTSSVIRRLNRAVEESGSDQEDGDDDDDDDDDEEEGNATRITLHDGIAA